MIIKELFMPGSFEEAYLYQGHLLLIDRERRFQAYNLEELISSQLYLLPKPEQRTFFEYLFSRNDWFSQEPVKRLLSNPAFAELAHDSISRIPDRLEVDLSDLDARSNRDLGIIGDYIFDVEFYRGRMYVATEVGLMYQDLDWRSQDLELIGQDKKVGARCVSVAAAYGVVDASCGNEGLIVTAHDRNDYSSKGFESSHVEKRIADRSIRSGWLLQSIVNYAENDSPELHTTATVPGLSSRYGDTKLITEIDNVGKQVMEGLNDPKVSPVADSSLFVYNSTRSLFVQPSLDEFIALSLDLSGSFEARYVESYAGPGARLLTAEGTGFGLLARTRKDVLLFRSGQWTSLHSGEVSCLRSFAKSKRYRNMICVCDRDGLHLKAVITSSEVPSSGKNRTRSTEVGSRFKFT